VFPINVKETRCDTILSAKCSVFLGLLQADYGKLFLNDPSGSQPVQIILKSQAVRNGTYFMFKLIVLLFTVLLLQHAPFANIGRAAWKQLDTGLELGIFQAPQSSEIGDSLIRILRASPEQYKLVLLNVSKSESSKNMTAKEWSRNHNLIAAINAGMYQKDNKTSVAYMKTRSRVINRRLSRDKTILAFDRVNTEVPEVKIIDRQCDDFSTWKTNYQTLIQSIRMISCTGKNVWQKQATRWSTSAIAVDHSGRVLMIHSRSPYSTHDFIKHLKQLPIGISRAMYLEGGSEAQLFINMKGEQYEFLGMSEANFDGNIHNETARPIPNVIGLVLKASH
jgi:hypothetical protein